VVLRGLKVSKAQLYVVLGGLKVSETQIFVVLEGPKVSETPVWVQRRKHKANPGGRVDNSAVGRSEVRMTSWH
jgi:hypothetical protein